ncbi:MAG TPA: hypothetical protein VFL14_12670 [Xanthomonadales bacterium]|nr:hypothetical protein [Xanthomonadales bacterium]
MISRGAAWSVLSFAAGVLFVAWPLANLLTEGPFAWHFAQSSVVQGGIELLVLAGLLFGALSVRRESWRLPVAGALLAMYLRRHHADLVAFVAVFQLELLLAAGAATLRAFRAAPVRVDGDAYLRLFVTGLGALATLYLASSLLGNGQARDLRGLAVILAVPAFALARLRPLAWHAARRAANAERTVRAIAAVLAAWLAATFARTANVLGYDSPWYGLRGELVLAPEHSLFDATGLVSPVYYFPKLYELLLLPLNDIGTYQHAMALGVAMLAMIALAAWRIARALGAREHAAAWATLVVVSMPVVANHGITTKSDLLAVLLLLIAVRAVLSLAATRARDDALLALGALLLAVQAKLATGPFCAAIGVVLLVLAMRGRLVAPSRTGWISLALATTTSVALTARTYVLAGVPTIGPDPLLKLWLALGFEMREPVGSLDWIRPQVWGDVPLLVFDLLARPAALPHVVVTWTGNVWLWCALVALVAGGTWRTLRAQPTAAWLLGLCGATGLWLALGQRYYERGGDGNYFMLAPVLATIALVPLVLRRRPGAAAPLALALFVAMQLAYSFVSAGWGTPGTRAWDLDFTRGPDRAAELRYGLWDAAGMLELASALDREPRTLHVVGDVPEVEGFLLRVRFEPLSHLYFSHGDRFESVASLQALLDAARVDALVVPAPGKEDPARILPVVLQLTERWRGDPAVRRVPAGRFELLVRQR